MNILLDRHHSDLLESLHRLFEDRLGLTCYVPFGMEWQEQGYWRFGQGYSDGGQGVAKQFLVDAPEVDDLQPHRKLRRVSLEDARRMDWTLVMASVPDNYEGYHRFAWEHGGQFGVEVGNVNQWVDMRLNPFILDSTGKYGQGVPFTPEFDLDDAFRYVVPSGERYVASFVNLFPHLSCFGLFTETALETMAPLGPPWTFGVFGHGGPDGFVKPTTDIAHEMAHNAFGWHDKVTGDGFGYVIHYWAAVGRPLIGHASHYAGQIAADLWEDGVTCIDLDQHPPEVVAVLMENIVRDRDRHEAMCSEIARRVRARIDFARDAENVAKALNVGVPAALVHA